MPRKNSNNGVKTDIAWIKQILGEQKEVLSKIVDKLDRIEDKVIKHETAIGFLNRLYWWVIGGMVSGFIGMIYWIIRRLP